MISSVFLFLLVATPDEMPFFDPTENVPYQQSDTSIAAEWGVKDAKDRTTRRYTDIASMYMLRYRQVNGKRTVMMELTFAPRVSPKECEETDLKKRKAPCERMGTRFVIFDFKGVGRYLIRHDPTVWSSEVYRPGTTEMSLKKNITLIRKNFASFGSSQFNVLSTGYLSKDQKPMDELSGWIDVEGINHDGAIRGRFQFTGARDDCPAYNKCELITATVHGKFYSDVNRLKEQDVTTRPSGELIATEPAPAIKPKIKPRIGASTTAPLPRTSPTNATSRWIGKLEIPEIPQANARYDECPAPTGSSCKPSNETYYEYRSCWDGTDDKNSCKGKLDKHKQAAKQCMDAFEKYGC